jgi:hypothetical protein
MFIARSSLTSRRSLEERKFNFNNYLLLDFRSSKLRRAGIRVDVYKHCTPDGVDSNDPRINSTAFSARRQIFQPHSPAVRAFHVRQYFYHQPRHL